MKKSKYIGKYDYIGYYTKPEYMWFFSNHEIQKAIETKIALIDRDNDSEEDKSSEEVDAYNLYREALESKDIDENNAQILEGRIIDQKSKKYIINQYEIDVIYDFDDLKYRYQSMEELSILSIRLFNENENIIIFQPVFIKDKMITKPDAVIKKDGIINLVETKGTTTTKSHHFLDIFFQHNVLKEQPCFENYDIDYFLCIVHYCKLDRNDVSFVITPFFNYVKSISFNKKIKESVSEKDWIEYKSKQKLGEGYLFKLMESFPFSLTNAVHNDVSELLIKRDVVGNTQAKLAIDRFIILLNSVVLEFNQVIKKLVNHRKQMGSETLINLTLFKPSKGVLGSFKDCNFWPLLRKLYPMLSYNVIDYSGKIIDLRKFGLENIKTSTNLNQLIKQPKKNPDFYINLFINDKNPFVISSQARSLLNKLKSKKVYFDFETINSSIRAIDDSLPFMQIVTQCSILKDHGLGIEKEICNNLVIDPVNINTKWFMQIIDDLYEGEDYSYVVYNKSFESSRLIEMAAFIRSPLYDAKVITITNNLYDLADFFNISSNTGYRIVVKELHGFYSIKKVLPLVKKYNPEIFEKTKCLEYDTLDVYNGLVCQQATMRRFFQSMGDEEWKELEKNLKVYCENDVRAMVAVEYFVKLLLTKYNI